MSKYYYDLNYTAGRNSYSTAIVSDIPLDEDEVVNEALLLNRIDPDCHINYVDELTEEEYKKWFGK